MRKIFKVGKDEVGKRLDKFLSEKIQALSRTKIKELIKERFILVNEKEKKPNYSLQINDEIKVFFTPQKKEELPPFAYPVEIIYEDEDIIVVNKPRGLVVHPPNPNYQKTLINALIHMGKKLSDINPLRKGVVHRLDKETSGVLVLAKKNEVHLNLVKQFQKREVKKEYRAIVWGMLRQNKLKISLPLKKTDIPFKMKVGFFKAKEAFTEIEVIKRGKDFSFLSVKPISGRTHQIRVHLSFLGYPIVGDKKYGCKDKYDKLFLHAYRLGLYHPSEGNFVEFEAPLPEYFLKFLKENV